MAVEYRYAGPDGEGIDLLPEGIGAAVGSEYCVHLLPFPDTLAGLVERTGERGNPLLLLTPYFRDAELKRALGLFRAIPPVAHVEVAVNDWGLLLALRALLPRLPVSIGRLLSGQKRCPRIGISPRLTDEGRRWHGGGVFSSSSARRLLEGEYGVKGYHVDDLEWMRNGGGEGIPEEEGADGPGRAEDPPRLVVHSPYSLVTVSDRCPWIGGRSSAELPSCSRPCLGGTVGLFEPSMGKELILRGKARFARNPPPRTESPGREARFDRVRYGEVP